MKTILEEASLFSKYEEGFYRYAYNGLRGCLKKFVFKLHTGSEKTLR